MAFVSGPRRSGRDPPFRSGLSQVAADFALLAHLTSRPPPRPVFHFLSAGRPRAFRAAEPSQTKSALEIVLSLFFTALSDYTR